MAAELEKLAVQVMQRGAFDLNDEWVKSAHVLLRLSKSLSLPNSVGQETKINGLPADADPMLQDIFNLKRERLNNSQIAARIAVSKSYVNLTLSFLTRMGFFQKTERRGRPRGSFK